MKKISLTQGKVALVDDIDYEYLNQWKWCASRNSNTFYAQRRIRKDGGKWTTTSMHQVLAKRLSFKHQADHINGNGLDNQRSNLRDSTNKQNQENRGVPNNNTSGCKGVHWYKRYSKWQSRICHNGERIHLGYFDSLEYAMKARLEAEDKYFTHT